MRTSIVLPLVLALSPLSGPGAESGKAAWPTCHGDYSLDGVSDVAVPDLPVRLWKIDAGGGVSSTPVAGGGLIFYTAGGAVCAVGHDGKGAWSRRLAKNGGAGPDSAPAPDSFSAPLLYVPGMVVCASESGVVHALDAASGEIRWKREIGQRIAGQPNFSRTGHNGQCVFVVTQPDGALHCLSLADGRVMWSAEAIGRSDGHPGVGTGKVVLVGCDSAFHAFSVEDGSSLGSVGLGDGKEMAGGAAVSGALSFAGNRSGGVVCVDWTRVGVLWATASFGEELFTLPAVTDERVVFAGGDGKIYAARPSDGGIIWSFDTGGVEAQSPVIAGNRVLAPVDGVVHILDLRGGKEVSSVKVGDGITAPAVVEGMFVVGSDGGQVTAFGRKPAAGEPQP